MPKTIGAAAVASWPSKPLQQSRWPERGGQPDMRLLIALHEAQHRVRHVRQHVRGAGLHAGGDRRCSGRFSRRTGLVLVVATICDFPHHFTKVSTSYGHVPQHLLAAGRHADDDRCSCGGLSLSKPRQQPRWF
ncbi:hypothetical protein PR003_g25586 [Phytophthora rubi]|uniref:Uncharacterized protein n=1 Tax=Phytophthora rubi TaxID=129364 RepID=A0A6A4CD82_9STRA|nr:hypothetical protein PR003_g25586 [Phytophthora rubi]